MGYYPGSTLVVRDGVLPRVPPGYLLYTPPLRTTWVPPVHPLSVLLVYYWVYPLPVLLVYYWVYPFPYYLVTWVHPISVVLPG